MSDPTPAERESIARIAADYVARWRAGERPAVEEVVRASPAAIRERLARELVRVEAELRREAGESAALAEFSTRFPEFASEGDGDGGVVDPLERTIAWPPVVGNVIAENYEILEFLGEGALGSVYRARRLDFPRVVAIKLLKAQGTSGAIVDEASAATRAGDHVNIATVYHVGWHEGRRFLEMQFVDGHSLEHSLRNGPLPPSEARDIAIGIARALQHAWRANVVHRDIKTTNVMIARDGVVKVVDFGLARSVDVEELHHTTTICGTPAYMSPEQWNGVPIDTRADQYALGVTLFRMLTGGYPFAGQKVDVMHQHCRAERPRADRVDTNVPRALGEIVARMMAIDPGERFGDWNELISALERFDLEPGAPVPPPSRPATRRTRPRPRPPLLGTAITGACVLAGMIVAMLLGWFDRGELAVSDALQRRAFESVPPDDVAVVIIDQDSKDELAGDGPVSRETLARNLALLGEDVAAIGVDILFVDRGDELGDGDLATNTSFYDNIVHAVILEGVGEPDEDLGPIPEEWTLPIDPRHVEPVDRIELPIARLRAGMTGHVVGHVAIQTDVDGTLRRVPHLLRFGEDVIPSLSLATVMRALGVPRDKVRLEPGRRIVLEVPDGGELAIPVDVRGRARIDFTRPVTEVPLRRVDANDGLLDGPGWSKRVVFLGSKLPGDHDIGSVPVHPQLPLVEAHAIAAANILSGRHLVGPSPIVGWGIVVLLLALGCAAGGLLPHVWGAAGTLLGAAGYIGIVLTAFDGQPRLVLPVVAPLVGMTIAYGAAALVRHRAEAARQTRLADLLGRSLPPRLVRRFLRRPESLLGVARRNEVSVLCVRVHRPERFGQRLEAEDVLELLEPMFEAITETVLAGDGTLEWLNADGCCAIFGDPDPQPDHVARAIECAWRLRNELLRIVRTWTAHPRRVPVEIGIGIDSGYVTAGHVGNDRWLRYTAVGSAVDEAEQLARSARNTILLSDRTRQQTAADIDSAPAATEELDAYELRSFTPATRTHV